MLQADEVVRAWFAESLARPFDVNEDPPVPGKRRASRKKKRT